MLAGGHGGRKVQQLQVCEERAGGVRGAAPLRGAQWDREERSVEKGANHDATSITRWIGVGLLGLPLYGVLTLWSSIEGQPDPSTHLEAWSRFVTTDQYALGHLFGSILGLVFAIFGVFALGAYLATSRAGRLGLVAVAVTVLGSALFLPLQGVSTFAAPRRGRRCLRAWRSSRRCPPSSRAP
jgi:hypothetical protein